RHPGDVASTLCYVDIDQYPEHMVTLWQPNDNLVLLCRPELHTTFLGVYVIHPSMAYGTVVSHSMD
ncbi:11175_t:CDS:2, partial [Acaulospora morrowiae]